jgi:hypothetical protein
LNLDPDPFIIARATTLMRRDEVLKKYGSIDGCLIKGLELTKRDI